MGVVRRLLASLCVVTLGLGVVSASTLGTFGDVALSAGARDVCHGEAALVDDVLGIIPLSTPNLYDIDAVQLTELDPACDGLVPVVVVVGQDPWLSDDKVLAVEAFPALDLQDDSSVTLTNLAGDLLGLSLDFTTVVTDVRVAFCPVAAVCT